MKLKTIVVSALGSLALALALAPAASAETTTLGTVTPPSGSAALVCLSGDHYGQVASASTTPYSVPARGKEITAWQTSTREGYATGTKLKLLVLRWQPETYGGYEVVGTDTEALPESAPSNEIASFTPVDPIAVQPGDILGLEVEGEARCAYEGGGVPSEDLVGASFGTPWSTGEQAEFFGFFSEAVVNVSATVALRSLDLGVATSATPASAIAGQLATLSSTISNVGEMAASNITFVDEVQSGLSVSDAVISGGTCSINGQKVTCIVPQLAPGAKLPVVVMVSPQAAGSYLSKASVSSDPEDLDPANNSAQATLTATAPPSPAPIVMPPAPSSHACYVPALRSVRLPVATKLLSVLDCKLGKVRKRHSAAVVKGAVISTQPHAGTHPAQMVVALTVSSGPAKHKRGLKQKDNAGHHRKHGTKQKGKARHHRKHGAKHKG